MSQAYYPIFLDLEARRCVVVGGGLIAQRKVTTLLSYGARITVVSPTATQRLRTHARQGNIRHLARRFRPGDVRGAWLVYAATNDESINQAVFRTATRLRIFTNVVDQVPLCSFIAPAIFRRDPLTIAISTGGASPTVAKRLRRELGRTIGAEYARLLRLLQGLRGVAKQRLPSYRDRKRYFEDVVDSRVVQLIRSGHRAEARRQALRLLDRHAGMNGTRGTSAW